jgi:signal transduction histidine kinase
MRTARLAAGIERPSGEPSSASGSGAEAVSPQIAPDEAIPGPLPDGLIELVDRAPLAMAIVDAESHEVHLANAMFAALSPTPDDLPAPRTILQLLPQPAGTAVADLLDEVRRTGQGRSDVELRAGSSSDGERCWRATAWPVTNLGRQRLNVVLQLHDVTHEMSAQREMADVMDQLRDINGRLLKASLRESELAARAEAASEAKSTFLSMMSHELRTPLTAIIGYEELLADGIIGEVSEMQRTHLGRIKASADHLLALIDQVLTLARVEAKREIINWETVDLQALTDWVSIIVRPLVASKGLAFSLDVPDRPIPIRTDPLKVRQVLVNLLGNAVKFTDEGGVTMRVVADEKCCRFIICDTGMGIATADLGRIFNEFWQVEQRATRRVGGSGLGLSVSLRLARLLGGDIQVESVVGDGTTFTFILPLDAQITSGAA